MDGSCPLGPLPIECIVKGMLLSDRVRRLVVL